MPRNAPFVPFDGAHRGSGALDAAPCVFLPGNSGPRLLRRDLRQVPRPGYRALSSSIFDGWRLLAPPATVEAPYGELPITSE